MCFGLCEPLLATAADKPFQSSFRTPCAPILAFCTFQKPSVCRTQRILLNIHKGDIPTHPQSPPIQKHGRKFKPSWETALLPEFGFTTSLHSQCTVLSRRQEGGKRLEKLSDVLLNSRSSNSSRMQSLSCPSECVHREGGMGALQIHGGRELVPLYSPCPPNWGILLIAPLPSPAAPAPSFSLFFPFLSVGVHFETCPLWRVKGLTS